MLLEMLPLLVIKIATTGQDKEEKVSKDKTRKMYFWPYTQINVKIFVHILCTIFTFRMR